MNDEPRIPFEVLVHAHDYVWRTDWLPEVKYLSAKIILKAMYEEQWRRSEKNTND